MFKNSLKSFLNNIWLSAMDLNKKNIMELLSSENLSPPVVKLGGVEFLDLGCDEGTWSVECGRIVGATVISGVDIVEERLVKAAGKGVHVINANLNNTLPISDNSQDIIHANQVIEHVADIDVFAREILRVLKPGGSAVISTENASSWCNVFATMLGWQMFSLTNLSATRSGIGNPLALHRGESIELSSWTHKTIFSYCGLLEFFEAHGFYVRKIRGAGYFPLPSKIGLYDPRHAHFITVLIVKPSDGEVH